jgi:hypothetical protein
MKMAEVRVKAKTLGIGSVGKSKETVIRAIQAAEGNRDCFNRGQREACGQETCAWRGDCK